LAGRAGFPKLLSLQFGKTPNELEGQATCQSPSLWGRCPAGQRGYPTARRQSSLQPKPLAPDCHPLFRQTRASGPRRTMLAQK